MQLSLSITNSTFVDELRVKINKLLPNYSQTLKRSEDKK